MSDGSRSPADPKAKRAKPASPGAASPANGLTDAELRELEERRLALLRELEEAGEADTGKTARSPSVHVARSPERSRSRHRDDDNDDKDAKDSKERSSRHRHRSSRRRHRHRTRSPSPSGERKSREDEAEGDEETRHRRHRHRSSRRSRSPRERKGGEGEETEEERRHRRHRHRSSHRSSREREGRDDDGHSRSDKSRGRSHRDRSDRDRSDRDRSDRDGDRERERERGHSRSSRERNLSPVAVPVAAAAPRDVSPAPRHRSRSRSPLPRSRSRGRSPPPRSRSRGRSRSPPPRGRSRSPLPPARGRSRSPPPRGRSRSPLPPPRGRSRTPLPPARGRSRSRSPPGRYRRSPPPPSRYRRSRSPPPLPRARSPPPRSAVSPPPRGGGRGSPPPARARVDNTPWWIKEKTKSEPPPRDFSNRGKDTTRRSPPPARDSNVDQRGRRRSRSRSPARRDDRGRGRDDRGRGRDDRDGDRDRDRLGAPAQPAVVSAVGNADDLNLDDIEDIDLEVKVDEEEAEQKRLEALRQKRRAILAKFSTDHPASDAASPAATATTDSPAPSTATITGPGTGTAAASPKPAADEGTGGQDSLYARSDNDNDNENDNEEDAFEEEDLGFAAGDDGANAPPAEDEAENAAALRDAENEKLQHFGGAPLKERHGIFGPPAETEEAVRKLTGAVPAAASATAEHAAAASGDEEEPDMFSEKFQATNQSSSARTIEGNADLSDNWDDADGYYRVKMGEVLKGRYEIYGFTGQGVFSNVVRARDAQDKDRAVAIKILRNNLVMYKSGLRELEILQQLQSLDPKGRFHCVKFLNHFKHRNHLCLVFEHMALNLREVQIRYGRNKGLSLKAVQSYTHQLLLSLRLLRKAGYLHADIKPDNILVNEKKNIIKLCDLGSAFPAVENQVTPTLCSRYYRAPEIMIGQRYSYPIDMWSLGTTVFEAWTGKIMFKDGHDNNEMLKLIFEVRGRPSIKWIKRGEFRQEHFTDDYKFMFAEVDKVTKNEKTTLIDFQKPTRELSGLLQVNQTIAPDERRHFTNFKDLLDKMLQLDPDKRITPAAALKHPFITEKIGAPTTKG